MADYIEGLKYFENNFLPESFYDGKKNFVTNVIRNRKIVWNIIQDVLRRTGSNNPYEAKDFATYLNMKTKDKNIGGILVVNFPKERDNDTYHKAVMIYDKSYKKLKYFVIGESTDIEGKKAFIVCSIDKNGLKINHKRIETELEDEQINECVELFLSM